MLIEKKDDNANSPIYEFYKGTNIEKLCSAYNCTVSVTAVSQIGNKPKMICVRVYRKLDDTEDKTECIFSLYPNYPNESVSPTAINEILNDQDFLDDLETLLKKYVRLHSEEDDLHWCPHWLYSQDTPPSHDIWAWVTVREYNYNREFVFAFPCQYNKETGYWRYSAGDGSMNDFVLDASVPSDYSHDGYVKYYMPIGYKPNGPEDDCVG